MDRRLSRLFVGLAALLLVSLIPPATTINPNATLSGQSPAAARAIASPPLRFEPNLGQFDPAVRYLARANGYQLYLTDSEAVMVLPGKAATNAAPTVLRYKLAGANAAAPTAEGLVVYASLVVPPSAVV